MRLLLVICVALKVVTEVSTASSVGSTAMMNMAMITELDVICDKAGMTVTIDFSQPFNGIIFSKGHYSNSDCRYVEENSGQSSYTIRISSSKCGSLMGQVQGDPSITQLTNTIIVQNDKTIQEIWDVARSIRCDWVDNYSKTVNFNPFTVGMLQAKEVRFQGDQPIECWMDLLLGKYPDVSDINSIVKIGDSLSLLVYARDNDNQYDVAVKDCYAFAGPDYDNPNTPRLQLTDTNGCVIKDKLISQFYTAREDDGQGSTLVTYAFVYAFKFPDVMDVFMTCNIEICKGDCDDKCTVLPPPTTTPEPPRRYGSTLFGEPIYTTKPTPFCKPGSTIPECLPLVPTPAPCYEGSSDPACNKKHGKALFPEEILTTTPKPTTKLTTRRPKCYAGSTDPSCKNSHPIKFKCHKNSKNPRCRKQNPITTTPRPRCHPGSRDPRCPKPPPTVPRPRCFAGSRDPNCPLICDDDSDDPRCHVTTSVPDKCFPGSLNPNCEPVTKDGRYGSILFPATITTTPTTTTEKLTTPVTVPFTVPTVPTTTPRRSGGILFGEPITTPKPKPTPAPPRLKPKTTTTKSPNRGKQLSEPKPKPEPTGKEWEGESRFHAFHSFHYQKGDGRRSRRNFGKRLVPKVNGSVRKIRSTTYDVPSRPLVGKMPIKLSSSLHVASPLGLTDSNIEEIVIRSSESTDSYCLSFVPATSLFVLVVILVMTTLFFIYLFVRQRKMNEKRIPTTK